MSLPRKPWVLPDVDLSHDEGDPRWHEAGGRMTTPVFNERGKLIHHAWNGLEPGHYAEYWRLCVKDNWAMQVGDFEREPDDVYFAYWYVDNHPAFWAFSARRNDDYPANHVSRLEHEGALAHRSWPEVLPYRDDRGLAWCYEFGKRSLFPDEYGMCTEWLDYKLIGHADTYEQAIIDMARTIHENYGNDRQVVDSEEWRKGGGDGDTSETQEPEA